MAENKKDLKPTVELTEDQILKWKEQYGEVFRLVADDPEEGELDGLEMYFRPPGRPELSRFASKIMKDTLKGLRMLVLDCLLFPSKERLEKVLNKKPGLVISLGTELQKSVGVQQDFTRERL